MTDRGTEAEARAVQAEPIGAGYAHVYFEPTPYDVGITDDPELEWDAVNAEREAEAGI